MRFSLILLQFFLFASFVAFAEKRPNLVLIMADDMGDE